MINAGVSLEKAKPEERASGFFLVVVVKRFQRRAKITLKEWHH
jgi:hypothetical protein